MVPNKNKVKILIVTGIYPPEVGGPSEYAKNLKDTWSSQGYEVSVRIFSRFNFLPTGIRHLVYFCYILPAVWRADFVFALDTFSAAMPSVLATRMLGKKIILRTGGDFLWELYVERTGELVLLKDFYQTCIERFSAKERKVFKLIKFVLQNVDAVAWSTEWQRGIFMEPYSLSKQRHFIVENYYGPKIQSYPPVRKNFVAGARPLKWKNGARLRRVFEREEVRDASLELDMNTIPHGQFLEKIQHAYAVIMPTLGDISPNTILDSIRANKPFILTQETGFYDKLKDVALFVDPESEADMAGKVLYLANQTNYELQKRKVENFTFTHTWEDIGREFITIYKNIK